MCPSWAHFFSRCKMILTLEETKKYLKVDYDDEDEQIKDLIQAAEIYLKQATGKEFDSTNHLAKLYCKCLVYEWFRYKGVMGDKTVSDKTKYTLQSIALQLKYT